MPVTCPDADLELLQADARSAAWLVLVAPLPVAQKTALLEAAAVSGRPVLLIDPQLEAEADLASQLALEAPHTLVACSELLAAEAGEQSWYVYNDRRRNGTVPPDGLVPRWPNLRLEGTELRPARRLDAMLSTWLEQAVTDGSQPGLLWLPATQAPQVLAGAGAFLERLATIWLEGAPANDGLDPELVDRLEASCHRLERDGPKHQLWRLDGQRLVERELLLVTQQLEALQERCEELEVQLSAQAAQTTEQSQQREVLQVRVEEILSQYSENSQLNSKSREALGDHLDEIAKGQFLSLAASAICTILSGEGFEGPGDAAFEHDATPPSFRPAFELSPSRSGAIFHHPGSDLIGTALKIYGEWAYNEIELLLGLIDSGCCVYDVGAFVGTHSVAFAERVGPSGKVFAFEPNKSSFRLLAMNTCTERHASVRSLNLAIGASNGFVKSMTPDKSNIGMSVIQETADEFDRDGVFMKSLDSLDLDSDPSLIKIDTEGMELDVLEGATQIIARSRPFVYAEVNSVSKALALLSWSQDNNYTSLGCSHLAFNPNNFALNDNNIYGNARECAMLMIAAENSQSQKIQALIESGFAKPVANVDDLAQLLLSKPQYVAESAWP
jgi:FkbM family methyltransferase